MKTRMKEISSSETRLQQIIILVVSLMLLISFGLTYYVNQNINTLIMLAAGLIVMFLINFISIKLNAIIIDKGKIYIRSIINNHIIKINDYVVVKSSFLSPILYFIEVSGKKRFFFIPKSDFYFKSLLKFKSGEMLKIFNQMIEAEMKNSL
ncbi:hypothetical protein QWZ00_17430 [Belliella kenyensis]|uniref:hypothetical protein n=1 Tax=Belliella kenyensis TaxID=1472724 RepID=UPI0025B36E7F|nr:hypothetical protein [Belliella kenyensis]MDN3604899.1 hypothetical protein [Belliella kenyensis]